MLLLVYIILGIITVLICLILIAPKKFNVQRSITVERPVADVFDYLKHIKHQDEWSPWKKKDPNMQQEFIGNDGEVGFIAKWVGNKDVGIGEQEITIIVENELVQSRLRFFKPWKSESDAHIKVEEQAPNTTKVTWGVSGENKVPSNVFFLFFNMDKTVGKDFEEGLVSLKQILEQ
ncbi:MAG: SRPBCC family protein [Jejuia sp.]